MIEMINDLLKEAKEEIISLIECTKNFSILGKTIIEIKNVPGMKIINELKNIFSGIAVILGIVVLYIKNKIKRRH